MAELDRLNIRITSDAKDASAVIDKLIENAKKLRSVMKSLDKMANGGKGASATADGVSKSMKSADTGAKQVSKSMKEVASATTTAKKSTESLRKVADKPIKPKVDTGDIKKAQAEAAKFRQAWSQAGATPSGKQPAPKKMLSDEEWMSQFRANMEKRTAMAKRETAEAVRQVEDSMGLVTPEQRRNEWIYGDRNYVPKPRNRYRSGVKAAEALAFAREQGIDPRSLNLKEGMDSLSSSTQGQEKTASATSRLANAFASVREKLSGVYGHITRYAGDMEHARRSTERFTASAGRVALRGVSIASDVASSSLRQLSSFAKLAGLGIAGLASKVLAFPTRQLKNAFNIMTLGAFGKVAKNARDAGGAFQQMSGGVAAGLTNIMKYVLGFRTLFYLVRAIREGIAEGFKNLAKEDERTNESLSMLSSKLTQVKNSLATAFAPVLNTVRPILETLINYILDAINAVAQFFAALTGASTWKKATYTMTDFSAGASSAGDAADGANKSAKELRKTLLSFDKINRLNDDTGSSGSGGSGGGSGGGGGSAGSGMFETAEVATGISNFANMVKQAWANADFTDVGRVVGEKLADSLNNIPWTSIQSTANKFGTSFATFINGLVSVTELATALGTTFGQAINTVFGSLNSFVTNLKFGAIGDFIAEAMNAGIETIKFGTIADTIAKATNGYFSVIGNWAGKFKFSALGTAIETTITGTLDGIQWKDAENALSKLASGIAKALNNAMTEKTFNSVAKAVAGGINTAVSAASSLVKEINWSSWGSAVASGVNKFFKDVNWGNLGVSFSTAVSGILNFLAKAITDIDWENVGKSVVEAFGKVKWDELFIKAAKLINVGVNALVTFVEGIFKGIAEQIGKWFDEHLPESVKTAIEGATKIKEFLAGDGDGSSKTASDYGSSHSTRTVDVTANMVDTKDSIPPEKKKIGSMTGSLASVIKDATTRIPTVGGIQGTYSSVSANASTKKPAVAGIEGVFGSMSIGKNTNKPVVAGIAGVFGKITANKKTKKPTVKGVKGNLTSLSSSGLSRSQRTVNVSAKVTSIDDSNLSVYMKFKAKNYGANDAALGAVFKGGRRFSLPQYAAGGSPSHGTMFVAGEAGAEMVGHINGRTEVLNRSQMASVMYNAVLSGMTQALANTQGTNPTFVISPDPAGIFRVVQTQANRYTATTGKPAFNI